MSKAKLTITRVRDYDHLSNLIPKDGYFFMEVTGPIHLGNINPLYLDKVLAVNDSLTLSREEREEQIKKYTKEFLSFKDLTFVD